MTYLYRHFQHRSRRHLSKTCQLSKPNFLYLYNLRIQTKTGKSAAFSGAQIFRNRQSSLIEVLAVHAGSGELSLISITFPSSTIE